MIKKILMSIYIPLLLVLYAIIWISVQPLIMSKLMYVENMLRHEIYAQVTITTTYVLINIVWLATWYYIARIVRKRAIK